MEYTNIHFFVGEKGEYYSFGVTFKLNYQEFQYENPDIRFKCNFSRVILIDEESLL